MAEATHIPPEDQKKATEWLKSKTSMTCPMCGTKEWHGENMLFLPAIGVTTGGAIP